jgi:hypothetical protein
VAGASTWVPVCPVTVRRAVTQTVTRASDLEPGLTFSLRTQRLTHGTLVEGVADGAWRA